MTSKNKHLYHLVDRSPWPIVSAFSAMIFVTGLIMYMHRIESGLFILFLGFICLIITMGLWWRDVVREATFQGKHTQVVQRGLKMGFILFLMSEIMVFFGCFWAFFHASLSPSFVLGGTWPPVNIEPVYPWGIPFLNTLILILSGCAVTCAHYSIIVSDEVYLKNYLLLTIILGLYFMTIQMYEYIEVPFNITDGVYGSTFFSLTGLHGFHVFVGIIFLSVCFIRFYKGHFTSKRHLGFVFAIWYWHFVDIVWLFLFVFVYVWGAW